MRFVAFCVLSAVLALTALERTPAADDTPDKIAGRTIEQWIDVLSKNPDPSVREGALRVIPQFGKDARKALPALTKAMLDADVGISVNAIAAFRAVANDKDLKAAVTTLITVLQNGPTVAKVHAALALGQLGADAKGSTKLLSDLVERASYSWEVRKAAALALGRVAFDKEKGPTEGVVRALTRSFDKTEPCAQVRLQAIIALGMLNAHRHQNTEAIIRNPLSRAKDDADQAVAIWARVLYAQLGGIKPEEHVAYITSQMEKNKEPATRAHAIQGLSAMGTLAKPKIPNIIDRLRDDDATVTTVAAATLGSLRLMLTEAQVNEIGRMVEGKDAQTRSGAATALANIGLDPGAAANQLPKEDKDRLERVRTRAIAYIPGMITMLEEFETANAATGALGQLKDELTPAQIGKITQLLGHKDADTRCHAARMLGVLGAKAKDQIPALVAVLQDKEPGVVVCVIMALVSFGGDAKEAVPALKKLRDHKDESVKETAQRAIDEINGR